MPHCGENCDNNYYYCFDDAAGNCYFCCTVADIDWACLAFVDYVQHLFKKINTRKKLIFFKLKKSQFTIISWLVLI